MNKQNIRNIRILFILLILICGIFYIFYYKNSNISDIESKLISLQENKNIEQKDFSHLLESIMPKRTESREDSNIESKNNATPKVAKKEIPKENKKLQILAIIDDEAYITDKWYHINDKISHNNKEYVIKKIKGYTITLVDSKNNKVFLEMFPHENTDDFYFEKIK